MADGLSRTFLALELLQTRDLVSGAELAERLGVEVRTVQRYITKLRELGVPVVASRGVGGAYRLRAGFRLPPLLFTDEEAFALSLGLRALRQVGLESFAPATEGALAKLTRVLPERLRENIRAVEDAVSMEPSPWTVPASVECLTVMTTAIRTGHRIQFAYTAHSKAETERTVEPYAVLHADGRWYLLGRCLQRRALRSFRIDRVARVTLCAETFDPPDHFDARAYFASTMPYATAEYLIDAWIDMTVEEARQRFALWRVEAEADGAGTRLRAGRDKEGLPMFAAMLLATGRRIEVREPQALREVYKEFAVAALKAATGLG